MENSTQKVGQFAKLYVILKVLLVIATGLVLVGWWINTPPGLLGKADAAGYAVCHRISSRSFFIGDRQTPLCARCSGMYLGAVLGIVYLASFGKKGGMPPLKISIILGLFLIAFAFDGANSYFHFFPGAPGLYQPENWLRLLTGTGVGIGIASVLVPVVHQTIWQRVDARAALAGWRQFIPLLILAGVAGSGLTERYPRAALPPGFDQRRWSSFDPILGLHDRLGDDLKTRKQVRTVPRPVGSSTGRVSDGPDPNCGF